MKKTTKQKNKFISIWGPDFDFRHCLDVDYNETTNCLVNQCGTICKCGVIDPKVTKVRDISYISNSLLADRSLRVKLSISDYQKRYSKEKRLDIFFKYCVDRLVRIHKLFDPRVWETSVQGGYYGQELGSVTPPDEFQNDVKTLRDLSPNRKIEFVLEKEYGYLLNRIKHKTWKTQKVPKALVVPQNETYRKKISLDYRLCKDLPIGIYIKNGQEFELIDGYHRLVSSNRKEVEIIYCEKHDNSDSV